MKDRSSSDTVSSKDDVPLRKQWYLNRNGLFLAFNVLFVLTFFGPLRDLVRTSWNSENDNYIPFIPFISAYLIHLDRQKIFALKKSFSVIGLLAVGAGILLLFFGINRASLLGHRDYLSIITFSAVTLWIGGFTLTYGIGSVRAAIFPLLFLFLMVPIPGAALEKIILFLQTASTEASSLFFHAAGVPVARDGFVFHLPTLDVEVAKQCSGIHSSLALLITGVLAAYLFLRTGWARVFLMITIVPIAIVKNGIRIFTLSILGAYWDKRILDSDLHRKGGVVFFLIALVLVWAVIVLLRKMERRGALKDG
jgi:exosortase